MRCTLLAVTILTILWNCDNQTDRLAEIRSTQKTIDSLWTMEISDSLRSKSNHHLKQFALSISGRTIRVDNVKIENWPEDIASFHDVLYTEAGRPIASQDAVLGHAESCLSRHYFDDKGHTISRLIDNWYYDDSLEIAVDVRTLEFYSPSFKLLKIDSVIQDEKGNKLLGSTSKARLDGKAFPSYKTFDEFVSSNNIDRKP
jgi:hypothetical protein